MYSKFLTLCLIFFVLNTYSQKRINILYNSKEVVAEVDQSGNILQIFESEESTDKSDDLKTSLEYKIIELLLWELNEYALINNSYQGLPVYDKKHLENMIEIVKTFWNLQNKLKTIKKK